MDGENKPMGKVTKSEKVADRLGSSESEKGVHVSGNDSPGKGVVDKFKGAFTSWFGKGLKFGILLGALACDASCLHAAQLKD
ncbi:hypothetical protein IFM89_035486 [Coptis chinensis]|uniref:Uncharacterized protein n=1 Tax=Coptis chinensis TaxID=261450 RepID=A0A835LJM4_9MAGN|nr:hypothetical protein IFM89_035486 [Coptis chinensis]